MEMLSLTWTEIGMALGIWVVVACFLGPLVGRLIQAGSGQGLPQRGNS